MQAKGVLPDPVIRDWHSDAHLIFADLRPDLSREQLVAWLQQVSALVTSLTARQGDDRAARVAVSLGSTFFTQGGASRFGLDGLAPVGLLAPPSVPPPADPGGQHDILFYAMSTSEALVADFLKGLADTRPLGLAAITIERGFQRRDGREPGGFRDGLRNVPSPQRPATVFVNRDELAEEPGWTEDGTYLAYMKLRQNLDAWSQRPAGEQEQIIGRRLDDGSRLDLPKGSNAHTEGEFTDPNLPAANSHVRKAGPRGPTHDHNLILRRGVPYFTLAADGSPDAGLQFVSFQASLDAFDVILNRWMLNPDFPAQGSQADRIFTEGIVTVQKAGFYFAPPQDDRFIAASLFDPPKPDPRPRRTGRILIRKRLVDPNGAPVLADLSGAGFQVFDQGSGNPIGDVFLSDPRGHATSPDVPVRVPLSVREVGPLPNTQPPEPINVTVEHRREVLHVDNRTATPGPVPYGR
jgi:Dyp-type peroxidase family